MSKYNFTEINTRRNETLTTTKKTIERKKTARFISNKRFLLATMVEFVCGFFGSIRNGHNFWWANWIVRATNISWMNEWMSVSNMLNLTKYINKYNFQKKIFRECAHADTKITQDQTISRVSYIYCLCCFIALFTSPFIKWNHASDETFVSGFYVVVFFFKGKLLQIVCRIPNLTNST